MNKIKLNTNRAQEKLSIITLVATLTIASFQVFYMKQQNEISQRQAEIYQQQLIGNSLTQSIIQARDDIRVSIRSVELDEKIREKTKVDSAEFIIIENTSLIPIDFPIIQYSSSLKTSHQSSRYPLVTKASIINSCETLTIPIFYLVNSTSRNLELIPEDSQEFDQSKIMEYDRVEFFWSIPSGYIAKSSNLGENIISEKPKNLDIPAESPLGILSHQELYDLLDSLNSNKNQLSTGQAKSSTPLAFIPAVTPPDNFKDISIRNQFDPRTPTIIDNRCENSYE